MANFRLQHYKIDTVLKAINCAKRNSKNIMLSGSVGTGKTTLCSQVADKLSLDFYPISLCQQTTKSDLIGYLDANGNYRTTALREAYQNGGLVLLDEMDASNPNVISIINNILSNEQFYFPDGLIQKNSDFKCICSMNTNGRGGDVVYTKSHRLDASTLDRFIFIEIGIDENLEREITDNKNWYERVIKFRKVVEDLYHGDIIIGSRAMYDGADLLENGFSLSEVEDMVIYKGIDKDAVDSIKAKMNQSTEVNLSSSYTTKPVTVDLGIHIPFENSEVRIYPTTSSDDNFNIENGLVVFEDTYGNKTAYLDEEFCKDDNFKLAHALKSELNLR